MRALIAVAGTGLTAVLLSPFRSFVTLACLVTVLLPYLVGLGLSRGIQAQAQIAVRSGADLYVAGSQFGRDVPVPLTTIDELRKLDGVRQVVPRIIGHVVLGGEGEAAVVVGLPPDRFQAEITCIEGRLPSARNEVVLGTDLAQRLNIRVGERLAPFYRNRAGEKISVVVGLFRSDVSLWQSRLMLTTLDTATAIFDQPGLATDLLLTCRPGYQDQVRRAIVQLAPPAPPGTATLRFRVTSRDELLALIPSGLHHREGIFSLLFLVAFAVGVLVVAVTSGFGLSGRQREIGILKATGWQTDEILLRASVESLTIVVLGFSVSLVLAFIWLSWFNGFWVAGIFLSGVGIVPSFRVPYQLAPIPALLGLVVAFVVVMTGTISSTWRSAIVSPFMAIRSSR